MRHVPVTWQNGGCHWIVGDEGSSWGQGKEGEEHFRHISRSTDPHDVTTDVIRLTAAVVDRVGTWLPRKEEVFRKRVMFENGLRNLANKSEIAKWQELRRTWTQAKKCSDLKEMLSVLKKWNLPVRNVHENVCVQQHASRGPGDAEPF
jgi:hypothetical protein